MPTEAGDEVKGAGPVVVHGYFVPAEPKINDLHAGLAEIGATLRRHWIVIPACVAVASVASLIYSTTSAPRYRASALVAVVEANDEFSLPSSLSGSLGGLASLAGVRLPGGDNRVEAVAVLKSDSLAEEFIGSRELMPLLFADEWDANAKRWREGITGGPPTMADAVKRFSEDVHSVQEDGLTGLVKVTVRWKDPASAAEWANGLVNLANQRMRQRTIEESSRSIEFLRGELGKTENIELRQAIFRLMQSQLHSATLANVRREFAFRTIDPARAPDRDDYVWPRPMILVPLGAVVGLLFGGLLALVVEQVRLSR